MPDPRPLPDLPPYWVVRPHGNRGWLAFTVDGATLAQIQVYWCLWSPYGVHTSGPVPAIDELLAVLAHLAARTEGET